MSVNRILCIVFLLGNWVQSASARPEAHVAPVPAQMAMEIAVPAVSEDSAAIGGGHRCECPAAIQFAQSAVSQSDKFLLALSVEGSGALLNPSNGGSVAIADYNRTFRSIARPSGRPPYPLASRLRQ